MAPRWLAKTAGVAPRRGGNPVRAAGRGFGENRIAAFAGMTACPERNGAGPTEGSTPPGEPRSAVAVEQRLDFLVRLIHRRLRILLAGKDALDAVEHRLADLDPMRRVGRGAAILQHAGEGLEHRVLEA